MAGRERIDVSGGGNPLQNNPFAGLESGGLPQQPAVPPAPATGAGSKRNEPNTNRGRLEVRRQTAGRGGKTVTVVTGFKGIPERELQELARSIQRTCGVGGTVRAGSIEIQGDQRERACVALTAAGFRPVLSGG